jgi:hypothetical protein
MSVARTARTLVPAASSPQEQLVDVQVPQVARSSLGARVVGHRIHQRQAGLDAADLAVDGVAEPGRAGVVPGGFGDQVGDHRTAGVDGEVVGVAAEVAAGVA